jgi:hypothetical protein
VRRGALAALALALAACQAPAATGGAPTPAPGSPVPLAATLTQYRRDQARGVVQVKVANTGTEPVHVEQVRLDAPAFPAAAPTVREVEIRPGRRVDLPITYGAARCGDGPPAGAPAAVARVRVGNGEPAEVRLALPSPNELLERLAAAECAQRAVRQALVVAFGPSWSPGEGAGGATLRGTIVLRRGESDAPLTLTQLGGSTLFNLTPLHPGAAPLLRLEPGAAGAELPVEVTAPRCEPHALADSKRAYSFPVWVTVGGGQEQHLVLEPDEDGRRHLDELVRTSCGL